jgi:anti-sigma regulatory factor (Ser/Thr protein kinase)
MATYLRRTFEPSPESVSEARAFLREALADRAGDDDVVDELQLALSELATNAVRHAGTPFEVVVQTEGHVRIAVEDASSEAPVPRPESASAVDGRGIGIVAAVCDRWGVHVAQDRKCVWCERDLT